VYRKGRIPIKEISTRYSTISKTENADQIKGYFSEFARKYRTGEKQEEDAETGRERGI
jgi:hypothetical protein